MKKVIAMVLVAVMMLAMAPVFAEQTDSAKMQEVLLLVKEKIAVSEEFSEFSGNVSEYDGKRTYHFDWTTPDYEKSLSIESDELGRIIGYRQNAFESSEKRISAVSKRELIEFAEEFLRKTVPEAFLGDSDCLVYDEVGYQAFGNLMYSLVFRRMKDGVEVKDNYANVRLCVVDDAIKVRSMDVNFVYDAEFDEYGQDVEKVPEKYRELFPVELIYRDEYKPLAKGREARFSPVLIYRIKDGNAGYMDSDSGEILTEDSMWEEERKESAEDATINMGASAGGSSLTPQELAELEKVAGLKSRQEIEDTIKKLPYLDFPGDMVLKSCNLYQDGTGIYYYQINYASDEGNGYRYFNIRANAKTGELTELTNYTGGYREEETLTDAEKVAAEKKIEKFLKAAAKGKLSETEKTETESYGSMVYEYYTREVNGVPYMDHGIRITFDAEKERVVSYSLLFMDGTFEDPKKAIGADRAYNAILEYAPITPIYIRSNGLYQKAFTMSKKYLEVDAISGKIKNKDEQNFYQYLDMEGHWAEEAALKLAEIQIGFPGEKLEPEKTITQEEFLRFLASAVKGPYFGEYSSEEFYERLIREKLVLEEEKDPERQVLREEAFVYVIRMAGLERVAKLSDIYQVSYHDQEELSPGKLGYAAILSGLGVICGDGGNLRPQDSLIRGEAIAIVYRYLLSL